MSDFVDVVGIDDPVLDLSMAKAVRPLQVISESKVDEFYHISLSEMSCTCPDFILTRKKFIKTDPRRACKHIVSAFVENDLLAHQSELATLILISPTRGELGTFQTSEGMIFSLCFEKSKWVSVFTRKRRNGEKGILFTGGYETYGYDRIEKRWSYGDAPSGARYYVNLINQLSARFGF